MALLSGTKRRHPHRKRLLVWALALITVFCFFFGGMVTYVHIMKNRVPAPTDDYEAIIVLGAKVKENYEPSLALLRRMTLALIHHERTGRLIICCGAQGTDEPMAEGDFMRGWMIEHGVPEELVLSENQSYNTRQNIENAKGMLAERGLTRVLVVTSDYHLPRALATCRAVGLTAMGDGSASEPSYWLRNHLREALSWIKFGLERK